MPKADQKKAAQTNAFPTQVQQQKVVGQYQSDHRSDKEVHIREKSRIAFVVAHVLNGEEMNQEAHSGNHQEHEERNSVEMERDLGPKAAAAHPHPEVLNIGVARRRRRDKAGANPDGQQRGKTDGTGTRNGDHPAAEPGTEQDEQRRAGER